MIRLLFFAVLCISVIQADKHSGKFSEKAGKTAEAPIDDEEMDFSGNGVIAETVLNLNFFENKKTDDINELEPLMLKASNEQDYPEESDNTWEVLNGFGIYEPNNADNEYYFYEEDEVPTEEYGESETDEDDSIKTTKETIKKTETTEAENVAEEKSTLTFTTTTEIIATKNHTGPQQEVHTTFIQTDPFYKSTMAQRGESSHPISTIATTTTKQPTIPAVATMADTIVKETVVENVVPTSVVIDALTTGSTTKAAADEIATTKNMETPNIPTTRNIIQDVESQSTSTTTSETTVMQTVIPSARVDDNSEDADVVTSVEKTHRVKTTTALMENNDKVQTTELVDSPGYDVTTTSQTVSSVAVTDMNPLETTNPTTVSEVNGVIPEQELTSTSTDQRVVVTTIEQDTVVSKWQQPKPTSVATVSTSTVASADKADSPDTIPINTHKEKAPKSFDEALPVTESPQSPEDVTSTVHKNVDTDSSEDIQYGESPARKASFSTIILVICLISILIVLSLVAVVVIVVRARVKRRGKYEITSDADSAEGATAGEGQSGNKAVVTVQYNDSCA